MRFPPQWVPPEREHVRAVIAMVEKHFPHNPGSIGDFDLPTTRADALAYADDFFAQRLDGFGP